LPLRVCGALSAAVGIASVSSQVDDIPAFGEYEGSTPHARHTRIRGVALLRAALVGAPEIVPKERRSMCWVALG
jgi:hypothetical protein